MEYLNFKRNSHNIITINKKTVLCILMIHEVYFDCTFF